MFAQQQFVEWAQTMRQTIRATDGDSSSPSGKTKAAAPIASTLRTS
jgi:hypothetical protein